MRATLGFENEEAALSAMLALAGTVQVEAPSGLLGRICEEARRLKALYGQV